MMVLPTKPENDDPQKQSLNRIRLRLIDIAADLRPLPTVDNVLDRLRSVMVEFESVRNDLELVIHIAQAEEDGLIESLDEMDRRLATGWKPTGFPVEEVVERLRRAHSSTA